VRDNRKSLTNLGRRTAAQLLRVVPGAAARRLKRNLRDAAWLSQADAVIVSFPKSGRTFVRAMLSRLFERRFGIDERKLLEFPILLKAEPSVPRLLFTHAGDAMRAPDEIQLDTAAFDHCTVILLARHPGDVVISWYHQLKHREGGRASVRAADQPLDQFIWREQGGIPAIVRFMNRWAEFVRGRENAEIVRYEDFLGNPRASLKKVTRWIGLQMEPAEISDAAAFGAFDNLKKLEREGYFQSSRLRPKAKGVEASHKVRRGISGDYRTQLSPEDVARVDSYIAENLDRAFGY